MKLYEVLMRKLGLWNDPATTGRSDRFVQADGSGSRFVQPVAEKPKTQEELIYNPIGSKVGGVVNIDTLDWRDYRFTVKSIEELTVDGKKMTDYVLLARPIGQPDVEVRLRVVPNPDSNSRMTHRAVVLSLYDSLAYDEGLHDVCLSQDKKFVVDDDTDPNNVVHDEFWRINGVGKTYSATLKTLADQNGDGKVDRSEVTRRDIDFWDYSRLTDLEGVEIEEFVFVQMNKSDKWFEIWKGAEVIPERIEVF